MVVSTRDRNYIIPHVFRGRHGIVHLLRLSEDVLYIWHLA